MRLGERGQYLPLDPPYADRTTVGGIAATGVSGPLRLRHGTPRSRILGMHVVQSGGGLVQSGGKVVKNVAGYDFCKLLTGSLGTLGVITQLTLKLKPTAEQRTIVACALDGWQTAEQLLAALIQSDTTPMAVELVSGKTWSSLTDLPTGPAAPIDGGLWLLVLLEGTEPEVRWMVGQLLDEWREQAIEHAAELTAEQISVVWPALVEFSAGEGPLVVQASVVPSATTQMMETLREVDPACELQAHAGNGTVIARFDSFPAEGLSRTLVSRLQPVAAAAHGNIVILSNPGKSEMTLQSVWGGGHVPFQLMSSVKQHFDPRNLLNPGRFVYR